MRKKHYWILGVTLAIPLVIVCNGVVGDSTNTASIKPTPEATSTVEPLSALITKQKPKSSTRPPNKPNKPKPKTRQTAKAITPGAYCSGGIGKSKKNISYTCKEDIHGKLRWRR